jgi:hypothetical protein
MQNTNINKSGKSFGLIGRHYLTPELTPVQIEKRQAFLGAVGNIAMMGMIATILIICFINALAFPDCSRASNDCFAIHYLWGGQ